MQIASFILVNDRLLRHFEDQIEAAMKQVGSPNALFTGMVPMRLQELGSEHTISIPLSSLFPLDQAAGRQREHLLSAFEDPNHPSRLSRMARGANVPLYYVSPARVREFAEELRTLRLTAQLKTEDVETLLGRRVSQEELPAITRLIEQFRNDLYHVYSDAAGEGKGVVVLIINEPSDARVDEEFPRAA
ncbi:MAG: hypothetical protein ACYDCO_16085 [Armatimonadota bacterium]